MLGTEQFLISKPSIFALDMFSYLKLASIQKMNPRLARSGASTSCAWIQFFAPSYMKYDRAIEFYMFFQSTFLLVSRAIEVGRGSLLVSSEALDERYRLSHLSQNRVMAVAFLKIE